MESYLSKFIPALANRQREEDILDTERMPSEEEIKQAHKEGKRFWFELSGPEKNRHRRLEAHAARRRQRKGQKAYNRAQFQQRQREATIRGQMGVLQGPDTPMQRNVVRALAAKHGEAPDA